MITIAPLHRNTSAQAVTASASRAQQHKTNESGLTRDNSVAPAPALSLQAPSPDAGGCQTLSTRNLATGPFYPSSAPWPVLRGDMRNSGCNPALLDGPLLGDANIPMLIRRFPTGNGVFSTPVIGARERIFVGSGDKNFYAFDPQTGEQKWRYKTDECIDAAACMDLEGHLYVPGCDGKLHVLDQDGNKLWSHDFVRSPDYSLTTIEWCECAPVVSPDGRVMLGNDNFYVTAFERDGKRQWQTSTGLNVWSSLAFGPGHRAYGASMDMHVYRFDSESGTVKWRTNTQNLIAASPAVGADGNVYIGNLGGDFCALDGDDGRVLWKKSLGGAIYGSPAIAPTSDGTLYIGSADGNLHAIDPITHETKWQFYTGDAIRSSAALGPDPEGRCPYLIYFGSGNGTIYALEPNGTRRWSYDTRVQSLPNAYPNINASIALGTTGLATASAGGEVFYIPYRYYLDGADQTGICRDPGDGFPQDGSYLYHVAPNGALHTRPPILEGAQSIALKLIQRHQGETVSAHIDPASIKVRIEPPLAHRIALQPNGAQLDIFPTELPPPGQSYTIHVDAEAVDESNSRSPLQTTAQFSTPPVDLSAPNIRDLPQQLWRISHMSIYDPTIISSFDQIGIASLSFDMRVTHVDPATGRIAGWGLLNFGTNETGEAVGVQTARHLYFAFGGSYANGQFVLDSNKPWFEITAFPVPLDRLRITGRVPTQDKPSEGSMTLELAVPTATQVAWQYVTGQHPPLVAAFQKTAPSQSWSEWFASWLPRSCSWNYLAAIPMALWRPTVFGAQFMTSSPHTRWGLMDAHRQFTGAGAFRASVQSPNSQNAAVSTGCQLQVSDDKHVIEATINVSEHYRPTHDIPGLLLIDNAMQRPLEIDYNVATTLNYDEAQRRLTVRLEVPSALRNHSFTAIALLNCEPLAERSVA